ncbi:MAG: translation initiation factor [Cytophagaceae bacterium]|jgi:translation initiation factor 1|nr:translation initiation factor [Cytophagaceae bacterium]
MSKNQHKNRTGVVYSTDPDFEYQESTPIEQDTLPVEQQRLKLVLDTKSRAGKSMTLIQGFIGKTDDLESLSKLIKQKLSVGGTCKNGEIQLQGDVRVKVTPLLQALGYKVK